VLNYLARASRQKYVRGLDYILSLKFSLTNFAQPSPNFYKRWKLRNWASIFDHPVAFEALWSRNWVMYRKTKTRVGSSDDFFYVLPTIYITPALARTKYSSSCWRRNGEICWIVSYSAAGFGFCWNLVRIYIVVRGSGRIGPLCKSTSDEIPDGGRYPNLFSMFKSL